jgi:hypothetical protein
MGAMFGLPLPINVQVKGSNRLVCPNCHRQLWRSFERDAGLRARRDRYGVAIEWGTWSQAVVSRCSLFRSLGEVIRVRFVFSLEYPNDLRLMSNSPFIPGIIRRIFLVQCGIIALATLLVFVSAVYDWGFFWAAFTAGCFGASLPLIKRARDEVRIVEGLENAPGNSMSLDAWLPVFMPLLYGGLLGGVTYFLFASGILSGTEGAESSGFLTSNLFPTFTSGGEIADEGASFRDFLELRPADLSSAGKLMVWCLIAGYTERFTLGLLDQLAAKGGGKTGEGAKAGGGKASKK